MDHTTIVAKDHFPATEDCHKMLLVSSSARASGEHNLGVVGGNWARITGDKLSR